MHILKLIKERKTVRKYRSRKISKETLDKIIEAGIWSPSIHGFQPWAFTIVTNKKLISQIANALRTKAKTIGTGPNIMMSSTANTISNAPALVIVHSTKTFVNFASKFKDEYVNIAKMSEIEAISAAIQNIILTADSYGIKSCWLAIPLFCEKEINRLIHTKHSLIAILTLGFPAELGTRSPRKQFKDMIKFIK